MKKFVLLLAMLVLLPSWARGEDWLQWRGPAMNGSTSEKGLPDKLDPEGNVLWKIDLPGYGASTPIIWENRLFLTAVDSKSQKLLALCFDNTTGKTLWQREIGEGVPANARGHNTASPSPITDGKTVWFFFASGELVAFDIEGKKLWERNLVTEYGPFHIKWLYASSPLLYEGKLFVQVLHRDVPPNGPPIVGAAPAESYLLAIDPASGKNIYRHIRPNKALAESKESYATPIAWDSGGRKEIILVGADVVTGHNPDTGEEYWRLGGWNTRNSGNYRVVATPVVMGSNLLVCSPHPLGFTIAIKPGGSGDITATHKLWEISTTKSDVPSPLVYENDLFILDGDFRKGVSRLDPATGQVKWFTPIESRAVFRSSPTAADGKVYTINENGEVWVLATGDGKILSNTTLATEGQARGSIVASAGKLFVRTGSTLYCFGSK